MRWKELFDPRILDRGWMYWQLGCVRSLEADGDSIRATVEGSEEYEVRITLRGGEIGAMTCSCPFAEGGENCKHMAAALFARSEEARPDEAADADAPQAFVAGADEATRARRRAEPDPAALVAAADEATLRCFLTEVLRRDPELCERFECLLNPERAAEALEAACARVDEVVERYMEDDFIDYRDAPSFVEEMCDLLDEEVDFLLRLRGPRDAFAFVAHALEALDGVDMDDSYGGLCALMCEGRDCVEEILDAASDADERYIFEQMLHHRDGDFAGDAFDELLEERFQGPYYQRQKLLRERRELAQLRRADPKDTFTQMEMECRAVRCLELMEETGAAREEIEALQREYWRFPLVRRRRMDELKRLSGWAELVEVAKESIALDEKTHPSLLPDYHRRLKEAYRQLGEGEAYRAELWALATRWMPGDLDCFREYRALFSAEDWPAERDRLLAALPRFADPGKLYVEEKLFDRLLERAVSVPELGTLQEYEKYLARRYPEQVLRKYARELDSAARNAAGREAYRRWAAILRHMRSLPGGEETVQELVTRWRKIYPRRNAMLDELKEF